MTGRTIIDMEHGETAYTDPGSINENDGTIYGLCYVYDSPMGAASLNKIQRFGNGIKTPDGKSYGIHHPPESMVWDNVRGFLLTILIVAVLLVVFMLIEGR